MTHLQMLSLSDPSFWESQGFGIILGTVLGAILTFVGQVLFAVWKAHREKGCLLVLVKDKSAETTVRVSNQGPPAVVIEEAGLLLPKAFSVRCIPLKADRPKAGRLERGDHQDYVATLSGEERRMLSLAYDKRREPKRRLVAYAKTAEGKYFYSAGWLARCCRRFHRLK